MADLEARVAALERRLATLEAVEGVRRTLSLYARAIDEHRPELLPQVFDAEARLVTVPWGADTRGLAKLTRTFERYWARFQNPRRYYANESITVDGDRATAFSYWFVTQEDGDRSVIGWGTYEWTFRLDGDRWKATELVIRILAMTDLDKGWAGPGRLEMPFERRA